jgi:hypothetical protein
MKLSRRRWIAQSCSVYRSQRRWRRLPDRQTPVAGFAYVNEAGAASRSISTLLITLAASALHRLIPHRACVVPALPLKPANFSNNL